MSKLPTITTIPSKKYYIKKKLQVSILKARLKNK
jgi:hypothetical protein